MIGGHGPRWVAERKNGLHPGLHTLITADLTELHAALVGQEGQPVITIIGVHDLGALRYRMDAAEHEEAEERESS